MRRDHREGQPGKGVLSHLQFFLFGCLLRENECSSSSLKNPEPIAINCSQTSSSKAESLISAASICELDEAKLVVPGFIGIFSTISDSEVDDDSTFVLDFKELLEPCKIDGTDGMNPDSPI